MSSAIFKPYKGSHQKAKDSKSNSMIDNDAGADISFGNNMSDKINPNNKSVAIVPMDMSKILP